MEATTGIQNSIAIQNYFAVFNELPLCEVGALAFIHGDLYVSVRNDDLGNHYHSQYPPTKWIKISSLDSPEYCDYCGSGWTESNFHPGTCGNCGAGALFAQRTNDVN